VPMRKAGEEASSSKRGVIVLESSKKTPREGAAS
jgi:hypothetical protein